MLLCRLPTVVSTHRPVLFSRLFSERELVALLLWMVADRLAAVGLLCCTGTHTCNTCGGFPGPREMGLLLVNVPVCGLRTLDVEQSLIARDGTLKCIPGTFPSSAKFLINVPCLKSIGFRP